MKEADPGTPDQQQRAAPEPVHRAERDECRHHVHDAGDDDIEEDRAHAVAGRAEDLFGVVEDHIDAAPLLQHGKGDADEEDAAHAGGEEVAEVHLPHFFRGDRLLDRGTFRIRRRHRRRCAAGRSRARSTAPFLISQRGLSGMASDPRKNTTAGIATTVNIQRHPSCPFHDMRMNSAVSAIRHGVGEAPVHHLRGEHADDDRELIQRHQSPTHMRRCDLGDVHRRQCAGHADRNASGDAPDDERGETPGPAGQDGGDGEQRRRQQEQAFPAEPVAHCLP